MAGEARLRDRRKVLTCKYLIKILSNTNHPFVIIWMEFFENCPDHTPYKNFFLFSKFLDLLNKHNEHMLKQPLTGALNYNYHTRFFSTTTDGYFGTPLIEFKQKQNKRVFSTPADLSSLKENIIQSSYIYTEADFVFCP